jgi:dipeptidyl aminopeptidase/acylaminoacyl peptidase
VRLMFISTIGSILCASTCGLSAPISDPQPLTPKSCTEVRYLAPDEVTSRPTLRLSHNGTLVSYVLQVPDLNANEYEDELYVSKLDGERRSSPVRIMKSPLIAAVTWLPDDRHLAVLTRVHGKIVLAQVDSVTKSQSVIKEAQGDITDYSINNSGDVIAIGVRVANSPAQVSPTLNELREGYRVSLDLLPTFDRPRRKIYLLRRLGSRWASGPPLSFISPLSGTLLTSVVDNHSLHISIAPSGQMLIIDNTEKVADVSRKQAWSQSTVVKYLSSRADELAVSYLYDLRTHVASMPLDSPLVVDERWAPDSKSYVAVALAPIGSKWEDADLTKGPPNAHTTHLFSINVQTGEVEEVLERAEVEPVAWSKAGVIQVQDYRGVLHSLRFGAHHWSEIDSFDIPVPDRSLYAPLASSGERLVMEYENTSTPPEIIQVNRTTARISVVATLNPQVDDMLLPRSEHITWSTSTGYEAKGLLLLPPDYDPHRRYPLVIENGSILYNGEFVCDAGVEHVSSFVRGILADAGIIYLMRYSPDNDVWKNKYYPEGYPGQIGEAAFQLDLVEGAVRYLDKRQMIDPTKVGLIGFSRGGWYTEYALAHSQVNFAAATVTDNMLYSMGQYWYLYSSDMRHTEEGMYGGPPYGAGLKSWVDYSISFNLDKIHTPLLMEVMGYGRTNDDPNRPLNNLAVQYEVFTGLSRLERPVELYFYPEEQHQMDHPIARITALQRNVDWYRFWLEGYERPNVADRSQYRHWEQLRELRSASYKLHEAGNRR